MAGVDSAVGPSLEQARAALGAGVLWWGWYCGGPGAWHNWRYEELQVLEAAGFELSLPIWVPGDLSAPGQGARDADAAMYITGLGRWKGVVALDTEAYMRGDPNLNFYVIQWCSTVRTAGWEPVVYEGGTDTMAHPLPGGAFPWWIIPGGKQAPPGTAWQTGQDTIAGLHVDTDSIGDGFPLATRV